MFDGDFVQGAEVRFQNPYRGARKLVEMAGNAIRDCLANSSRVLPKRLPVVICLSDRASFAGDKSVEITSELGNWLDADGEFLFYAMRGGRAVGVSAIEKARRLLNSETPCCLVVGVDSLLNTRDLITFHGQRRLLTGKNSDGFIPGEAAAAILLSISPPSGKALHLRGMGWAEEKVTVLTEEPFRARGLSQAIKSAISDGTTGYEEIDYRICDANGEQYVFKEATMALTSTLRFRKPEFDIWHPADCIGEIGAATVPCCLAVSLMAFRKGYAPGPGVLAHFGNDDGFRAAVTLHSKPLTRRAG